MSTSVLPATSSGTHRPSMDGDQREGEFTTIAMDHVTPTGGLIRSSSSSSTSSSPSNQGGDGHSRQAAAIENIPLAGEGGLFPPNTFGARLLTHCNCGLQDLRFIFTLLPCAAVLLFVTNQTAGGIAVVVFTFLLMCLIAYRLIVLLRQRNLIYSQLPRDGVDGRHNLHSLRYAQFLAQARANPSAIQLRLATMDPSRDFGPNDYDMLLSLDEDHRAQTFNGLTHSAIERLPTFTVPPVKPESLTNKTASKDDSCSVCLENKLPGEVVRILPCLHSFHTACIDPWLRDHTKCPVCQMQIQV